MILKAVEHCKDCRYDRRHVYWRAQGTPGKSANLGALLDEEVSKRRVQYTYYTNSIVVKHGGINVKMETDDA